MNKLKNGIPTSIPVFDQMQKRRCQVDDFRRPESIRIDNIPKVVVLEGILAFQDKRVVGMLDIKIFVDVDSDVRLSRRGILHD